MGLRGLLPSPGGRSTWAQTLEMHGGDIEAVPGEAERRGHLRPLTAGRPGGWTRPRLWSAEVQFKIGTEESQPAHGSQGPWFPL